MQIKQQQQCLPVRCELINFQSELAPSGEMSYRRQDAGMSSDVTKLRKVSLYANVQWLPMGMKAVELMYPGSYSAWVSIICKRS